MDVRARLDAIAADLADAGVRATINPQEINPPCAWVCGRTLNPEAVLCGDALDVKADIYLIAQDVNAANAHDLLGGMLRDALTVTTPEGEIEIDVSVALPDGGQPRPAYKYTVIT